MKHCIVLFCTVCLFLIQCKKEETEMKLKVDPVEESNIPFCELKSIVLEFHGNNIGRCISNYYSIQKDSLIFYCNGEDEIDSTHFYSFIKGTWEFLGGYRYLYENDWNTITEYALDDDLKILRKMEFDLNGIVSKIIRSGEDTLHYFKGISNHAEEEREYVYLEKDEVIKFCNEKEENIHCWNSYNAEFKCFYDLDFLEEDLAMNYHKLAVMTNMYSWSEVFKHGSHYECYSSFHLNPLKSQKAEYTYCFKGQHDGQHQAEFRNDYTLKNKFIQHIHSFLPKYSRYHRYDYIQDIHFYYLSDL